MTNPLDDYLMTKKAGPQGVLPGLGGFMGGSFAQGVKQNVRTGAEQAIGSGAVGLAATGLGIGAIKVYRAIRKRQDFKDMMNHNPDLQEFHQQDPGRFNAHYNSLRSMVPANAEDPIVAGSLMRNMSLNPENAGTVLTQSMESRSKSGPSLGMDLGSAKLQMKL
jgi:hypothetical protein